MYMPDWLCQGGFVFLSLKNASLMMRYSDNRRAGFIADCDWGRAEEVKVLCISYQGGVH